MLYKTSAKERKRRALRWNGRRFKAMEFVYSFLTEHPCVDCGESRLETLDFDHVRGKKIINISHLLRRGAPIPALEEEIAKCEVRCANCHRVRTAKQLNWFRVIWAQKKGPSK